MVALLAGYLDALNAQTRQGEFILGLSSGLGFTGYGADFGTLGYTQVKYRDDSNGAFDETNRKIGFTLTPRLGYFVSNSLAIGLDLDIAVSREKRLEQDLVNSTRIWGVGPFARYYLPGRKARPFFEISTSIAGIKRIFEYENREDGESKSSLFSYGGGAGVAVPLGEKITFDFMLRYSSMQDKRQTDNPRNAKTLTSGLGLKVGFMIYLGAKEEG